MQEIARYFPFITAVFSFLISRELFLYYREYKATYLLCWTLGVFSFGLAATAASIHVLAGWSPGILKFWYIVGALVGGFPLAQGTLYFLANKRVADITTIFFLLVIAVAAIAVALTPINASSGQHHELTGKVFSWKWVRLFSPIVNTYSLLVILGGCIYSAYKYYSHRDRDELHLVNINITLGCLLPGIGGILLRGGYVNVLFVLDFLALAVIYSGYRILKYSE